MANPLTDADKRQIDDSLAQLKEAEAQIKRAKLAGIDVTAQEAQVSEMKLQLEKIRSAYFPRG